MPLAVLAGLAARPGRASELSELPLFFRPAPLHLACPPPDHAPNRVFWCGKPGPHRPLVPHKVFRFPNHPRRRTDAQANAEADVESRPNLGDAVTSSAAPHVSNPLTCTPVHLDRFDPTCVCRRVTPTKTRAKRASLPRCPVVFFDEHCLHQKRPGGFNPRTHWGGNLAFFDEHCQATFFHDWKNACGGTIQVTSGDSAEALDRIFFQPRGSAGEIRGGMPPPWRKPAIHGRSSCSRSPQRGTAGRCVSACIPPALRPRASSRCRSCRSSPRRTFAAHPLSRLRTVRCRPIVQRRGPRSYWRGCTYVH